MKFPLAFYIEQEQPLPKQSFKVKREDGRVTGYTPAQIKTWQDIVSMRAKEAMQGQAPYKGYVKVTYLFYRKDYTRVDYTNLAKAVDDAMNGIVYKDDSQIRDARIIKTVERKNPGCYVIVEQWDPLIVETTLLRFLSFPRVRDD